MKIKIKETKIIILSLLVFVGGSELVLAWTGPTADPPSANTSAPINISSNPQTKVGRFESETYLTAPEFFDTDMEYYIDPNEDSWLDRLFSNDIRAREFQDLDDETGESNGYILNLEGVSNFNTIDLGGVERSTWPSEGGDSFWTEAFSLDGSPYRNICYEGGKVGIGTTVPTQELQVAGNILADGVMGAQIYFDSIDTAYYVDPNGTSILNYVYLANTITASGFIYHSDRRLKKDIKVVGNALEKVLQLEGVSFRWKNKEKGEGVSLGFIAQDVEKVFPEVVQTDTKTGLKSVEYGNLISPVIEAIKELASKIDDLFNKYFDQQEQIDSLKLEIKEIKERVKEN